MLVARGLSNGEIAAELVLSDVTVNTHVKLLPSKVAARGVPRLSRTSDAADSGSRCRV